MRRKSSPPIAPMMITAMGWLLENSGRVRVSNRVDVVGNWLDVQGIYSSRTYIQEEAGICNRRELSVEGSCMALQV